MPGIFGIIDLNGKIDQKEKIDAMAGSLRHEPWYRNYIYLQREVALGAINSGTINPVRQPVFNEDRSLCIIMHGEIYDYRANLSNLIDKEENDLKNILTLTQKKHLDFVRDLNGSFVFAIHDLEKRKLTIANDRYGLRPLYYFFNDHLLVFASEIKALLKLPEVKKQVDERAIAEFFSFDFILGDKTFFESIKVLPAASILTLQDGRLGIEQYWKPCFKDQDSFTIREEDLEKTEQLICEAVRRQVEPKESVGLFLSGGLDSRTILSAASRKAYSVPTYTFGQRGSEDEKIARQVAAALKCSNHFFQLSPDYLRKCAKKGVWLTEGMNSCINFHIVDILPEVREKSKIILYGLEGNTWLGFMSLGLLEFLFSKAEDRFIRSFFCRLNYTFPERMHPHLFRSEFYKRVKGLAFQSFSQSLKDMKYESDFNKAYHFFVTEKARRLGILGAVLDHCYLDYRLPFYDYDFVDFVQTIPPKQRALGRFYRRFVARSFPEVASITYQRTGLPVNSSTLRVLFKRGSETLSKKLKQKLFRAKIQPSRRLVDADDLLRYQLKDFITESLLNKKALSREYLNPSFIENTLDQHLSGKKNLFAQIGHLLTFELWNQLFLD